MEKILGNFLSQQNKDFPLDADTLDYLQQLSLLNGVLGNIAGDKVILYGCEAYEDEKKRKPGWVFVRTSAYPQGEILYWEGRNDCATDGIRLIQEDVSVKANNHEYKKAYTKRYLTNGVAENGDQFYWDEFSDIKTIKEIINDLDKQNQDLNDEIKTLQPPPLGIIQMWAGSKIPDGYLLCNGQDVAISKYPKLYDAIGTTFNTAQDSNGNSYSEPLHDYFRLPDLQGRFIVGQSNKAGDYSTIGGVGGKEKVTLTEDQLPAHKHNFKDYYYSEDVDHYKKHIAEKDRQYDTDININNNLGSGKTSWGDNDAFAYIKHDTETAGQGDEIDNRPPYYVLAYIMRAE